MANFLTSRLFPLAKVVSTTSASVSFLPARSFAGTACRLLYSKEALGLTGYEATRERTSTQLGTMKDRFKVRMEQYLSADSKSLIFTEDLKNMLYLADNEADLSMVERMMKKFVKQNDQLRFGSFVFGPVVMRMYHHLDKADEALKAIQDPELVTFFDQQTSYQLLMDLLYQKKRYNEVVKLYEVLLERPFSAGRYAKDCMVLVLAALHKVGTPAAYEKAKKLIQSATAANVPVMRKGVSYAADLALKSNDPAGCLELLSIAQNQSYVSIRNLKARALVRLDRVDDALPILRSVLEQDVAYGTRRTQPSFFSDVIAEVKAAVEKKGDKELSHDFEKAFGQLESGSHLDGTKLDDFLEREIEDMKARDGQIQGSFGRGGDGRSFGGYGQQQQGGFGGQRQPRYADDGQQQQSSRYGYGGGSGGGFRSRQSFGQDGQTREGRTDMASADDESTHSSRSDAGLQRTGFQRRDSSFTPRESNTNYDAGYRPRPSFNQRSSSGAGGDRDRYNGNSEAGYKPRGGYQRNQGTSTRQGLQDLDD